MEEISAKYSKYILLSKDKTDSPAKNFMEHVFVCISIIAVLYWVGGNDYLMFHAIIEFFSVAMAWALFILIWNVRNRIINNGLVFLGISYFFVGLLQMINLFAHRGMAALPVDDHANQVWLVSRIIESISLLAFTWLFSKRMKHGFVFLGFLLLTSFLLLTIFSWNLFPQCFVEGGGLTTFGKAGEYSIIAVLFFSMFSLYWNRNLFDLESCNLLFGSMIFGVFAGIASLLYLDVSGFYNQPSLFLKLGSLFLVYLALIRKGIKKPFAILFREIAKTSLDIRNAKAYCRTILDNQPDQIMLHDMNNKIIWANKAACDHAGLPLKSLSGRDQRQL